MAFECIVQSAMYIFYGLFNIDDEFCCHVWFFMNKVHSELGVSSSKTRAGAKG
jgi:hypothetical protein